MRTIYFEALKQAYDVKKADLIKNDINTFQKYVNESLFRGLAIHELTSRFVIESFSESSIDIRDRLENKKFEISIRHGELHCTTDGSYDCVHVFFAKEDSIVRETLEKKGIFYNQSAL